MGRRGKSPEELLPMGAIVRRERERLNMTPEDLAEITVYSPATIRSIETGHTNPSLEGLRSLCKALPEVADKLLEARNQTIDTHGETGAQKPRSGSLPTPGVWHGIWQTLRHRALATVLERIEIVASGRSRFELKNLDGARWLGAEEHSRDELLSPCRWKSKCEISPAGWIVGPFYSIGSPAIEGVLRLRHRGFEGTIVGYWMGSSYDNPHTYGTLVIGLSEGDAQRCFEQECADQPALPLAGG
jgi:transcriptional regulator with XRE-family HTH domain